MSKHSPQCTPKYEALAPSHNASSFFGLNASPVLQPGGNPALAATDLALPKIHALEGWLDTSHQLLISSFLAFVIPSVVGIVAKYWFLAAHGFGAIAAALSATSLSTEQRLSFFRGDLAFCFFIAPVGVLTLRLLFRSAWHRWLVRCAAILAVVIECVAWGQLAFLGNLPGRSLLMEGVSWSMCHPAAAVNLAAPHLFSPGTVVIMIAGLTVWVAAIVFMRALFRRRGAVLLNYVHAAAEPLWILGAILTILSWVPWMKPTLYHSPTIWLAAESLLDSGPVGHVRYGHFRGASIPIAYRTLAKAPDPQPDGQYWGAARGYNVVLFVMETGPARFLPWDDNPDDFPNVAHLARRAWVSKHHYTTSQISYKADTSILASLYPPTYNRNFEDKPTEMPGLIRSLKTAGYRTKIYLPYSPGPRWVRQETHFFQTLGPDQVLIPDIPPVMLGDQESWREADNLDSAALHRLEQDFKDSVSDRKSFFAMYLPQLSHDPWVDVASGGKEQSMAKRRYNLMRREDQRLGELLGAIEAAGQIDRTLILVTCDHGARSSAGDASIQPGRIDELTFNVPFLLYAPRVLSEKTSLAWMTSHIDVSPTILSLLGLRADAAFEAGTPIWNEALLRRIIFFWGAQYSGADGYARDNSFAMWNPSINTVVTSRKMHFDESSPAFSEGPEYAKVTDLLQRMGDLKDDWYAAARTAPAAGK